MKCPQCGLNEVVFLKDFSRKSVRCENCLYNASLGSYVASRSGGRFIFTEDSNPNDYIVTGNVGAICNLRFEFTPKIFAVINAEKPSVTLDLIAFIYEIFGNEFVINVLQEGADDRFAGCPMCSKSAFTPVGKRVIAVSCSDHFQVKIVRWAESVILTQTGLVVIHEGDWSFKIRYDRPASVRWWQTTKIERDLVADVQLRVGDNKTVLAVRQLTTELDGVYQRIVKVLSEKIVLESLEVIPIK